ncbi:MAG: hypothetical protein QOH78_1319, partial [Verrucomicrobiota bacterium]
LDLLRCLIPAMRERPSFKFAEPNYLEDEG